MAAASSELLPQPQPQDDEQLTAGGGGGTGGTASGTGRRGGKHRYGPQRLTGGGGGPGTGGGSGTVSSSVLEPDTDREQLTRPAAGRSTRSSRRSYCRGNQKVEVDGEEGQEEELVSSMNHHHHHYKHHKKQWQRGGEQLTKGPDYHSEQLNVDNSSTNIDDDEAMRKLPASTTDNGECPLKSRMNSSSTSSSINSISINSSISGNKQVATCMTNMDMVAMTKVVTRTTVEHCDHGNGRETQEEEEEEEEEETGHGRGSCSSSTSSLHNGRHSNHICGSRERLCCTPEARAGDVAFESHGVERAAQGEVGRAAQCEQVTLVKATTTSGTPRAAQGVSIKTNGAAHGGAPHCATTRTEVPTGATRAVCGADTGTPGQPLSLSPTHIESHNMKTVTRTLGAAQCRGAGGGAEIITEIGGLTYASLQPVRKTPADTTTRDTTPPICKIADTYSLSTIGAINNYPQSINMIGKGGDIDSQSIDMIPTAATHSDQQSARGSITVGTNGGYCEQVKGTSSDAEAPSSGSKPVKGLQVDSEPVKGLQVDSEVVKDLTVIQPGESHGSQSPRANTSTVLHGEGVKGGTAPPPPPDTQLAIPAPPDGATSHPQAPVGSIPDRHHPPSPPSPPGRGESSDQSVPAAGGVGGGVSERVNTGTGGGGSSSSGRRHAARGGRTLGELLHVGGVMQAAPGATCSSVSVSGVKTREAAQRNLDTILQRIMTQGKRHGGGGGRDSSSPDPHLTPARGQPNDHVGTPGACMDVPTACTSVWGGYETCTKRTDPSPRPAHNPSWIYGVSGGGGFIHNIVNGLPSQNGTEEVLDYSLNGRHSQTNGNSLKGVGKPTTTTPSDEIVTAHARRKRGGSGSTERRGGVKKPRGARSRGRVGSSGGGVKQSVNSSVCNSTPDPMSTPPVDTHPALPAAGLPLPTQPPHAESGGTGENSPSSCPPSGDSTEVPGGPAGWQHFASRLERINRLKEDLRQKEREVELIRKARQDPGLKGH